MPAAVHDGRQLTAVSALARAEGVRRGMRRRQAQGVCPELVLLPADDARDVRLFEPVAAAAETVVAGIEVVRAGMLLLPAGGASRYHGSEDALAEKLIDAVAAGSGHECAVGTADGLLAAVLAARTGAVVPPGGVGARTWRRAAMSELVHAAVTDEAACRGGRAGRPAAPPGPAARSGSSPPCRPRTCTPASVGSARGRSCSRAGTTSARPPAVGRRRTSRWPPTSTRRSTGSTRRRSPAAGWPRSCTRCSSQHSVTCGRLQIAARTDEGTDLVRTWRTDLGGWGGLTPARITDRIRWQLEGWLAASAVETARARAADDPAARARSRAAGTPSRRAGTRGRTTTCRPTRGPTRTPGRSPWSTSRSPPWTSPPAGAEQGRLWGGPSGGDLRAHRALDRVQGIVGGSGILVATLQGGRDVRDQVHLQPWGEQTEPARPVDRPWPGRLPDPAPATVLDPPERVDVRDAVGDARGPRRAQRDARRAGVGAVAAARVDDDRRTPDRRAVPGRGRRVGASGRPWDVAVARSRSPTTSRAPSSGGPGRGC